MIRSIVKGFFLSLLMLAASPAGHAADAVTPSAQLEANKKLVLDFWRVVIEASNKDAISQYMAPDLIQHNPNMANGTKALADLIDRFAAERGQKTNRPVEPTLRNPPVLVLADHDLVELVLKRPTPDPANPSKNYDRFTFDLYRVKDGKIVEHWDGERKPEH